MGHPLRPYLGIMGSIALETALATNQSLTACTTTTATTAAAKPHRIALTYSLESFMANPLT